MTQIYKLEKSCRICSGRNLEMVLDLGMQPPANAFLKETDLNLDEKKFPLRVFFCKDCCLVQLLDIIDKDYLFSHYLYLSSANKPLSEHFTRYASYVHDNFLVNNDKFLIEIGSNDGSLLKEFMKFGVEVLGIEPASNIAKMANDAGVRTQNSFFTSEIAQVLAKTKRPSVVIANNVVGHIENLRDFMDGIHHLIGNTGVFIFEVPYLVNMLGKLEYDTVYHEHLSYFSLLPLERIVQEFGLEIFDVQMQKVHGGTIRVFVSKKGTHKKNATVNAMLDEEKRRGLQKVETYRKFAQDVKLSKETLLKELKRLKQENKRIFGYGAPAKGNVLLNYCGISTETLDFVTDTTPLKQGLYTPGTRIPVKSPDLIRQLGNGDVALLLAWNYEEDIIKKEADFRNRGGLFIIPVPTTKFV